MMRGAEPEQATSQLEGERRLVTVLFGDLVGYTTMSESRDPELIQDSLNLCFQSLAEEITRFGGYVDKIVGDEIMALFGAPRAQEDDAGKAVAAGLAMQRRLVQLNPQLEEQLGAGLKIRIGINTGVVATGAVGPGGYTVTGDAVNVAARLEKAAEPGDVLVGESTQRLARRQYRWGERQQLTVKGRTEPVVCFTAEESGTETVRLVPAPSDTPYVGRQALLETLSAEWRAAAAQGGRVVELVGEAGVGKTRVLAHFFATANALPEQVLYTRADTPPRTFGPLLQLLPYVVDTLTPALRQRVTTLLHEGETVPDVDPDWLVELLIELVGALAGDEPLALVLDDMHRADSATVHVVEKLLPRLTSMRVMTVLLRQPAGRRLRRPDEAQIIQLDPLSSDEASALVARSAPAIDAAVRDTIVRRAGGNPLYLEMLSSAAAAAPGAPSVPESLQTAITARVDELDPTPRTVLREASVFGQSFAEETLKMTTTVSEGYFDSLARLREAGLLDDESRGGVRGYAFRHSLVQQVLYEGLLRRRRGELHLRAAEAMELVQQEGIDVEPEQIAFHFEQAGDAGRAAEYHLAAADRADQLRAPGEARSHRRTANRLIALASLAELYTQGRPRLGARAISAGLHVAGAAALLSPLFLLFATRKPAPQNLTLGLPNDIVGLNLSSLLIAVAIGGIPLFLAGIAFSHIAAPYLMRRRAAKRAIAACIAIGWALGLAAVLLAFGILIGLLRMNWLDHLSSLYVGGATLQLLVGNYSMVVVVAAGTLIAAVVWTVLLRFHAHQWTASQRAVLRPRLTEEARRWSLFRQVGLLAAVVGGAAAAILCVYQLRLLPNSELQTRLPIATFSAVLAMCVIFAGAGAGAALSGERKLRIQGIARRSGLIGFEVPLLTAVVFGLVAWYGMRGAVIVAANNVDTPGSVSSYDRAVSLFPNLGVAYYLRGERHYSIGELDAAMADFDKAIELDPNFPASYLPRARINLVHKNYDAVQSDANRVIELRPEHPAGYALRAAAEAGNNDLGAAAADLDQATKPLPADAQSWDAFFVQCFALTYVKQYDRAKPLCEKVLELNPGHIVSLDALGEITFNGGDYAAAADYYDQILKIDPHNEIAFVNRGNSERQLGQLAEAEADYTSAIALNPHDAEAFYRRAYARLYQDHPQDALDDANEAVRLDNGSDDSIGARLFVAHYAGDNQTAMNDASTLLHRDSEKDYKAAFLSSRGLSRIELGDPGGIDDLNEAIATDPEYAPAYDRRGYALLKQGDNARASADFDQALQRLSQLNPESRAELGYHRALLLSAQGLKTRATNELNDALKMVEIPGVRKQILELQATLPATTS